MNIQELLPMILPIVIASSGSNVTTKIILVILSSGLPILIDKIKNVVKQMSTSNISHKNQNLYYYLSIFVKYINASLYANCSMRINKYECGGRWKVNILYKMIEHYLSKKINNDFAKNKNNVTSITVAKIKKKTNNDNDNPNVCPMYKLSDNQYLYNKTVSICHNVRKEEGGGTEYYYIITASKMESINKFIIYIQQIYALKKSKHNFVSKYYIYNDNWISQQINVHKDLNNVYLDEPIKNDLISRLDKFVNLDETLYKKMGMTQKIGVIFYGLPGTGKTSLVYALSTEYKKHIYELNMNDTIEKITKSVINIPDGSIVCVNDIDIYDVAKTRDDSCGNLASISSCSSESSSVESFTSTSTVSIKKIQLNDLLKIFDGYNNLNKCIVVFTSNHVDQLDPALLRPGRIDCKYELKNASHYQIKQMFKNIYDYDLDSNDLKLVPEYHHSTAHIMNNIIAPNLNDHNKALSLLQI